jgi:hypothetical protein
MESIATPARKTGKSFAHKARLISELYSLAVKNCGSSKAAAMVLLSAYNIYDYSIDLGELCLLDPHHYMAAMTVIDLRCNHGIEPHTLFESGDEMFRKLAQSWAHLKKPTIH